VSAEKKPWYPWYPRNFLADEQVLVMTLEQEGVYRRLLDHQWLHGSIPSELPALAAICKGIPVASMRKLWEAVKGCFPVEVDGRLQNGKLGRVRTEADRLAEMHRQRGVQGAKKRWSKDATSNASSILEAIQTDSIPQSQSQSHTTTTTLPAGLLTALVREPDRWAVVEFLENAPAGTAPTWTRRLTGYLQGLDMPELKPATPAALGTACRDYDGDYSPAHFRKFIVRAMKDSAPVSRPKPDAVAVGAAWLARSEATA
jgi:uncharacterized protein YdaU (DUF1376 family)